MFGPTPYMCNLYFVAFLSTMCKVVEASTIGAIRSTTQLGALSTIKIGRKPRGILNRSYFIIPQTKHFCRGDGIAHS